MNRASQTHLFQRYQSGSKEAENKLYHIAYTRLRDIARKTREQCGLQHGEDNNVLSDSVNATTALVHDAYLKLNQFSKENVSSQRDFYLLAAKAMRQILIDNSRALSAQKRQPIRLQSDQSSYSSELVGLVSFEKSLDRFSERYPRQSNALKLKYYIGLTIDEISHLLECSTSLVEKDLRFSRAWLQSRMPIIEIQ
ncbi:ECF-type sigma factor [Vibrio sp.]|uniref:ECF-type sigma factor n=1 Tax=Vibrio sp. TaxID=678 RepID=UPI0028720969|nr:ECF-type sigma factor [Vibrio sp. FNV 38]